MAYKFGLKLQHGRSTYRADVDGERISNVMRYQAPYTVSALFGLQARRNETIGGQWVRVRKPSAALSAAIRAALQKEIVS